MGTENWGELIVISGATASGKTAMAIELAERLGCEIVNADSRQVYKEMLIGTAAPTPEEMRGITHHMVRYRSVKCPMNAFDYEQEVMRLLPDAMRRGNGRAILAGGSMMYIDAIVKGIDEMPTISEETRKMVLERYEAEGLQAITEWLRSLDEKYYNEADLKNPRRVLHAIEICIENGGKVSDLRLGRAKERPFSIRKFCTSMERSELYKRIDSRVDKMIEAGLEEEVRSLTGFRDSSPLLTVGYREMMEYLDGNISLEEAIAKIKHNTHRYAKKQETWLKRDGDYVAVSSRQDVCNLCGL
ncbi:MAG: tRNA (adenosine(37)-N6)-dimethylallyltransferase MiaA [Bacteroidales bacterium]|nr:tRNA (adenosine(37)-N6)-dimethylallyltransferase MiaA [Bacteroidales bacterium]